MATGLKSSVFIPGPKKGNAKECSNYRTIALISNASQVMLKILQARFQHYMNQEHPDIQAGFRKGRGTRDQIPKSVGSSKKQDNSRTTSTSVSFTTLKPLTMDHNKLWNILKEMGIPDHFTSCKTCMQDKKQQKQTWNNILVPNWERSTSRLYIITLRI